MIMEPELGGGNSNIFYFHPDPWGFMIHFDEHIFQMGWFNHQPEKITCLKKKIIEKPSTSMTDPLGSMQPLYVS